MTRGPKYQPRHLRAPAVRPVFRRGAFWFFVDTDTKSAELWVRMAPSVPAALEA